ncbi:hypothetical protein HNQ56_002718 [Anaerotaenia torta]|uniref:glycoside hydrolase family 43 protein n=1 Tax=Anaerotaenia torta TaxID=433293 RepID=UPI003D20D13A
MAGYLFVFFTGEQESGEQIYFSISKDGLHWEDLNKEQPVLLSKIGEEGVRDPFIIKDEKKDIFYLIATDLRIGTGKGWDTAQYRGSRDLIIWESKDLVHWSEARACTVAPQNAGCAWAPESIYDAERDEFFVFWASMVKLEGDAEPKQRIYGSYTKDFISFSDAFLYAEAKNHMIDMNIVQDNGWYYRFVKDETTKKIRIDRVRALQNAEAEEIASEVLDNLFAVEGPEAYPLPDGSWCLIVDQFGLGKGYLPLIKENLAAGDFTITSGEAYDLGKLKKRHGGVIKITDEEYNRLKEWY